jgi:hypothetical protein
MIALILILFKSIVEIPVNCTNNKIILHLSLLHNSKPSACHIDNFNIISKAIENNQFFALFLFNCIDFLDFCYILFALIPQIKVL